VKKGRLFVLLILVWMMMCGYASLLSASVTILHEFAGGSGNGSYPQYGCLTQDGTTLYGMTSNGGSNGLGTVFKIDTDGSGFQVIRSFTSGNGSTPYGSLTLSGSTLYGMTLYGGDYDKGVIFKIDTNSPYTLTVLHSFAGYPDDGALPYGSLTLSGSTLYGMTYDGGSRNWGTVFKIGTNGSGFQVIHNLDGGAYNGDSPYGSLTISGSTLYGMTNIGGIHGPGVIFKVNTDGSDFELLHSFSTSSSNNGAYPYGNLTLSGSTLYGMTYAGGSSSKGTIFKINTDSSSSFQVLHSFAESTGDGSAPYGDLTLSGSTLFGTTSYDGQHTKGTIFKINTDGSDYQLLHSFVGESDGEYPRGSLAGNRFYGMTYSGGASNKGVIFYLDGYTLIRLASFSAIPSPRGVTIAWRTGTEKDNAGFNVWRSTEENGTYTKLTSALILATGTPIQGASYLWQDSQADPGSIYYYKLEDIDTKGTSTFHGPLVADTNVAVGPASDIDRMVSLFLRKGWNFISLPLQPKDSSVTSLLSDISPSVRIIWGYENEKKIWLKYSPSASTLTSLDTAKGYWIYMAEEGVLTYTGQPASLQAIKLFPGWNLIGHRGIGMKPIAPVLSLLANKWKIIWNWTDDTWRMRSAALPVPPSFPSLNDLSQGRAYWIQVAPGAGTTEWAQ
jgi:uncharacterized repeat protein (TIGR03803 family)